MEPLRLGLLGAARISERAIVDPARDTGTRLVAVAARDKARAEAFADRHGIERTLASYDDVVTDPEVEAVYNPLANALHAPWNLRAIAAGKHVLSEKPFASNAAEAVEVRDAGKDAGVVVADAFHYRYHPVMRRLLEVVGAGEVGDVQRVEATFVIPAPDAADPRWSLPLAGGAMMDVGCYSIHAARSLGALLGGEPVLNAARGGERDGTPNVDEWLDANFAYPQGAVAETRCAMRGDDFEATLRVTGSRGTVTATNFVIPHDDDRVVVAVDGDERTEHLGTRPSYSFQLEAFVDAVRNGVPMVTDADDAVATMTLIDQCYEAAGFTPRPRYAG